MPDQPRDTAEQSWEDRLGRFIADLGHELRSPLNAIIGFAELLREGVVGPLNEEQVEVVDDILTAAHHLRDLSAESLDLSRLRIGRLTLQIEPLSVGSVAEFSCGLVRGQAAEQGVTLVTQIPVELAVLADERRLSQILCNLLDNAVRQAPEGSCVTVRALAEDDRVLFEVNDRGPGLAVEDQERIFDEFVSLGTAGRRGGTGLGLTLSRGLAELMGGSLTVRSAPGAGATFVCALPRTAIPK